MTERELELKYVPLKQNQFMLYQQVKGIQKEIEIVGCELDSIRGYSASIAESSALNAYYSALTATNTDITATFNIING